MADSFADEIVAVLMAQAPEGAVLNGALRAAIVAKCNDIPRKVWAVYADYDAEAPDTKDLIFCATEQIAAGVCEDLSRDPRAHNDLAYVAGCEGCKVFKLRQTWVGPDAEVREAADGKEDV